MRLFQSCKCATWLGVLTETSADTTVSPWGGFIQAQDKQLTARSLSLSFPVGHSGRHGHEFVCLFDSQEHGINRRLLSLAARIRILPRPSKIRQQLQVSAFRPLSASLTLKLTCTTLEQLSKRLFDQKRTQVDPRLALFREQSSPKDIFPNTLCDLCATVWLSALTTSELKRIVQESEITKCVALLCSARWAWPGSCTVSLSLRAHSEKMTVTGQRRMLSASRSSRFALATTTSRLKCVDSTTAQRPHTWTNRSSCRRPRLALWSTSSLQTIQKVFACFTISFKTSEYVASRQCVP